MVAGGASSSVSRIWLAVALLSLASTFLVPIVNSEWAGWRPDHGHLTISGHVGPHVHPWEVSKSHRDGHGGAVHGEASGDQATAHGLADSIVFTEGWTGGIPGIGALWAPSSLSVAGRTVEFASEVTRTLTPSGYVANPPEQPPQA